MNNTELKSKTGSPAGEENEFFGRENELNSLIDKVTRGDHPSIFAPRRVGKTSLMRRAKKVLEEKGNMCFLCDLEGKTPAKLIHELYKYMLESKDIKKTTITVSFLKNFFINLAGKDLTDLEKISTLDSGQWSNLGDEILKILCNSCPDGKRFVIFLDELGVMIHTMQKELPKESRRTEAHKEVKGFIEWLRSIRQVESTKKISLVIASSIGLHPLLKRLKLSADINDLTTFTLDAWEPEIAKESILALARGKKIEILPETAERMTEMIGWCAPYYVQVFFDSAYDNLFCKKREPHSVEDLSKIYDKYLIRGNDISPALSHMFERLAESLSEQEFALAKLILNKLAQNDGVTAKSEIKSVKNKSKNKIDEETIINVLDILEHDGYIEAVDNGYRFLSNILRDWWRNKYGN